MLFDRWDLLTRLRSGDRSAYIQVAERYHAQICGYIYRLSGDSELASDICQETAISLWKSAPRFENIRSLRAWLYKVAHNAFIDSVRRGRQRDRVFCEDQSDNSLTDPAILATNRIIIQQALMSLPDDVREAVVLIKGQDLTYTEAAEVLDTPVGTLKWRVSIGMKALRKSLFGEGETNDD